MTKIKPAKAQRPNANTWGDTTPGALRATTMLMVQSKGMNHIKANAMRVLVERRKTSVGIDWPLCAKGQRFARERQDLSRWQRFELVIAPDLSP